MNATTPDASLYAQRRARLAAQLGPGGIAIIPTAPERPRNRDTDFLYRHDSYFYYLTGFTEPNAWLVVAGDGRSTLWCQPKDLEREIWDGYRLGPEAAPAVLGVDAAFSVAACAISAVAVATGPAGTHLVATRDVGRARGSASPVPAEVL